MAKVAVSPNVRVRNELGRFVSRLDRAGIATAREAVQKGARISRAKAPVGTKADRRGPKLKASIYWEHRGTTGHWGSRARHAMAIEFGSPRHDIPGNPDLLFWWTKYGRFYVPSSEFYGIPGMQTVVDHPGNQPQPFLGPAFEIVMADIGDMYKKNLKKGGR